MAPAPVAAFSSSRSSSSGTSGMSQASTRILRAPAVRSAWTTPASGWCGSAGPDPPPAAPAPRERMVRLVGLDPHLGGAGQLRELRVLLGDDHDLLADLPQRIDRIQDQRAPGQLDRALVATDATARATREHDSEGRAQRGP